MSIWKTPVITCSVCSNEHVAFGDSWCSKCQAKVIYDFATGMTYQRALGSVFIVKLARYAFIGLMGLMVLILLVNLLTGETERAIISGVVIALLGLCVVGLFWFTHFLANRFISRHAITFVKE